MRGHRTPRARRPATGLVAAVVLALTASLAGCARPSETVTPATSAETTAAPATSGPATTVRGTTTPRRTVPDADLGGIDPALFEDLPDGRSYSAWKTVADVTDSVRVEVPEEWTADGTERVIEGSDVPAVYASDDQAAYDDNRSVAGLRLFGYPSALSAKGLDWALDRQAERDRLGECTGDSDRFDFADQGFAGTAVVTTGCGDDHRMAVVHLAATDRPGVGDLAVMQIQLVHQRDVEMLERAIRTFQVVTATPTTTAPPTTPAPLPPTPAPTPPVTRDDTLDYDRALRLVQDHIQSCGMGYDWTSANGSGGLWSVTIWIVPEVGGGDPGAGEYWVDLDAGSVTSTNGTANVLCPG